MALLSVEKLDAGYGHNHILHAVSFSVEPGEFVALIGPNGAGKSTVLKSLFGLAQRTAGTIEFDGHSIVSVPTHALLKRGVSYVPQGRIVFPNLTVQENLRMGGFLLNDRKTEQERMEEVFDRFPVLREKRNERARTLSGGQQQQLALGRALMMKPKLLLLDEPSLGLSPKLQMEVFEKLKTLQAEGMSILCVEQNVRLVLRYADRGDLLTGGAVSLVGSATDLAEPQVMERAFLR